MQQKLADVVDVVVVDDVVLVDVFRAWAIATKQNAAAAEMMQVVASDRDALAVQVQADAGAAAGFDGA